MNSLSCFPLGSFQQWDQLLRVVVFSLTEHVIHELRKGAFAKRNRAIAVLPLEGL